MRCFAFSACLTLICVGCASRTNDPPELLDGGPGAERDSGAGDSGTNAPESDAVPTVRIVTPAAGNSVAPGTVRIEGHASDDRGVASVMVRVGPNVPLLAKTSDQFKHWWVESPVPTGTFAIRAEARDTREQPSELTQVTVIGPASGSDEGAPSVSVSSPADASSPVHGLVLVRGTATDDRAVVSMDVLRNGELLTEREVETDDFFAHWARLVPLISGMKNVLTFVARDAAGNEGRAQITLIGRADIDREPPKLSVTTPRDADVVHVDTLTIAGKAADDVGVREVKVRVGSVQKVSKELVWSEYEQAKTGDGYATWSLRVAIPSGALTVEARAIDLSGLTTSVTTSLTNTFVATWGEEQAIPLRLYDETKSPRVRLELDEDGVNDVIDPTIQKGITLLELDTTDLLTNAVNQIKDSCGTRWREDDRNPRHDCSRTDYGKREGVPWQQSSEYSFVRLLTMTPKNAVVDGTSIDRLENIADALNVGGGFHEILADTLGLPSVTNEIVSTASVVHALQTRWMADHPEVLPGAKLGITLYDGMNDLAPLKTRFGPKDGHPGLLDPSFTPHATLFGPRFKLVLEADSNLRWMDGVDLTKAKTETSKDYIALVVDNTGPTFGDVLEFDFDDPNRFDVLGLVEKPAADLRMSMQEHTSWVHPCLPSQRGTEGCQRNLPNTPLGGHAWARPGWQVESLIVGAAYQQYKGRSDYRKEYKGPLGLVTISTVTVGVDSPPGWASFKTALRIGRPPEPQYLWDLILEVGQKALHDFNGHTVPEGEANVAFTLQDVDVGLTADDIRRAMRPELQKQRAKLSDDLVGNYQANNGAVDFYYRRGADGKPYVFFVAPSDPLPTNDYTYTQPGFFADPELRKKVSSKNPGTSGDRVHEKLLLTQGQTIVYVRDNSENTFRLRFVVGKNPGQIQVFVSRKVR